MALEIKLINFLKIETEIQIESRRWRNSEEVSPFFQIKNIDEKTHLNWLKSLKKKNPKSIAFLVEAKKTPVGVTYFPKIIYEQKVCYWGIYLHRTEFRGLGLAQIALNYCLSYAKKELCLEKMRLEVISTNHRAVHIYQKLGFIIIEKNKRDGKTIIEMEKTLSDI